MPTRILRDGILSSPRINILSLGAEVLYRRLMSVADDYGRFYASTSAIRGACWPTSLHPPSEQDVNKWLAECQQGDRPLLTSYEHSGCWFLQISDFNQKTRSRSKFPEPVRNLSTNCQQVADKVPALDVVGVGVGDVAVDGIRTEAKAAPIPPLNTQSEYPLVLSELRRHDPAADDMFVLRLVQKVTQHLLSHRTFPQDRIEAATTDKVISRACAESFSTGRPGHGVGLLLSRVPNIIVTWGTEKEPSNGTRR